MVSEFNMTRAPLPKREYNGKMLTPVKYKGKRGPNTPAKKTPVRAPRRANKNAMYQGVRHLTDNSSYSNVVLGRLWKSVFERTLYKQVQGRQTFVEANSGYTSSAASEQAVITFYLNGGGQLAVIKDLANSGFATDNDVAFYLGLSKMKLHLRNQSLTTCNMKLYDITTKRSPLVTTVDTPQEAWDKGFLDMDPTLTAHSLEVGSTPYKSPEFKQYFKVQKVTTVMLEPGQEHVHNIKVNHNRRVNSTEFDQRTTPYIGGITTWTIAVFYGSIGHDATTRAQVGFCPITIDWAWRREVSYGYTLRNTPGFKYTNVIPKAITTRFTGESDDAAMAAAPGGAP